MCPACSCASHTSNNSCWLREWPPSYRCVQAFLQGGRACKHNALSTLDQSTIRSEYSRQDGASCMLLTHENLTVSTHACGPRRHVHYLQQGSSARVAPAGLRCSNPWRHSQRFWQSQGCHCLIHTGLCTPSVSTVSTHSLSIWQLQRLKPNSCRCRLHSAHINMG